jgi:hypothetical protein
MPNICHSLCSLSALQFLTVPICNKLHLDQLLWNDAQKFLTCKCKTKSWSKPILLPWGLSIVYCPFNTKANTADLQDCVPHTSVLSTKPVGIMQVPSIVQEHRRSRRWISDWLVVDMYTNHIESRMCSSSLLVLPFSTRTGNRAQICRSHQSINMAQVQALSIAEIIAHTKQQPLPKLTSSKALIRWRRTSGSLSGGTSYDSDSDVRYGNTIRVYDTDTWRKGTRFCQLKQSFWWNPTSGFLSGGTYDTDVRYEYKIRIHEEGNCDFVR